MRSAIRRYGPAIIRSANDGPTTAIFAARLGGLRQAERRRKNVAAAVKVAATLTEGSEAGRLIAEDQASEVVSVREAFINAAEQPSRGELAGAVAPLPRVQAYVVSGCPAPGCRSSVGRGPLSASGNCWAE
jgi:hypothetical protein